MCFGIRGTPLGGLRQAVWNHLGAQVEEKEEEEEGGTEKRLWVMGYGLEVRGFLYVYRDLAARLSGASGKQF